MKGEELLANAQRVVDEEIRDRVVAGIAALEQAVKDGRLDADWPDRIDPATLTMSSAKHCVLGQVFAEAEPTDEEWERYRTATGYDVGPDDVHGYVKGLAIVDGEAMTNPSRHGFDAGAGSFASLQGAWLTVLDAR